MLISVDFDGTIVEHEYPRIGTPLPGSFETMRALIEAGHTLILNTCREDNGYLIEHQYLSDAVKFCEENGVVFSSHNQNRQEDDFRQQNKMKHRKVYAELYIDDKNLGGFPGWDVVWRLFFDTEPTWLAA